MRCQRGQATTEWVALVLLVVVVLGVGTALVVPGLWLPHRIKCAIFAGCDREEAGLARAYGTDVASYVRAYAPSFDYEPGTLTLPVDFRQCRSHACADAPKDLGRDVWRSTAGRQATVFTHAVDERSAGGYLWIQYWLYYPDSTWNGKLYAVGKAKDSPIAYTPAGFLVTHGAAAAAGHHDDDWESYQLRIDGQGHVQARASAHAGYAGHEHWPDLDELPDVDILGHTIGIHRGGAWVDATGWTHVSRGSHGGFILDGPGGDRRTEADGVQLVPIEELDQRTLKTEFPITPPWHKDVYYEPDRNDT